MGHNTETGIDYIYKGFFMHYIAWTIPVILSMEIEIITAVICSIGWVYIIKGFNKYKGQRKLQFRGLYSFLFIIYLVVTIVMIIRGYTIDYEYPWNSFKGMINLTFFYPTYILPYLMPLIVFIPVCETDFSKIVKYGSIAALIMIVCMPFCYRIVVSSSIMREFAGMEFRNIYAPFVFVVLLYQYIPTKKWLYHLIAFLCILFIAVVTARRGNSAIMAILFIVALYNWSKNLKTKKLRIFSMAVAVLAIVASIYAFNTSSLTSFIRDRGMEDSRSNVDKALLAQMNDMELIFGKGLNGRYYFPITIEDTGWRYGTETGFYNIVLKGGYLMAILHIILLLYPALLGIFKSRNNLCKMLGVFLIISLLELYPFGHLLFNFKFLIIWTGVLICYKKQIRDMSDKQIKQLLFK